MRVGQHVFNAGLTSMRHQRYQAQVALLSTMLKPTMEELEIGTVDGMQGVFANAPLTALLPTQLTPHRN